jgi:ketosteroid isomerase-like protein
MSEKNVEIVRRVFEALNREDLDALVEAYDPVVEIVTLMLGTYHGSEGARQAIEEGRRNLRGWRLDPNELIDAGHSVIAIAHIRGAGQHSGIALGDLMALSFTIRNGLIIRQQSFRSKEEALEAAGLRE